MNLSFSDSSIQLRAEEASDLPFIRSLYASVHDEVAFSHLPDEQKRELVDMQFRAQSQCYRQNYVNPEFWIIEKNHEAIGRLYICRSPNELRLIDISIVPEYRNQGIGSCLIRAIQKEASADSIPITLHAAKTGITEYYKRLGFKIMEEKETHDFLLWEAESCFEMIYHEREV